jgi:molecular chaperone DnaK
MYADMQAQAAAQPGAEESRPADEDVVDADFKEVKRDQ